MSDKLICIHISLHSLTYAKKNLKKRQAKIYLCVCNICEQRDLNHDRQSCEHNSTTSLLVFSRNFSLYGVVPRFLLSVTSDVKILGFGHMAPVVLARVEKKREIERRAQQEQGINGSNLYKLLASRYVKHPGYR